MDRFKLSPGVNRIYPITQAAYLQQTKKRPPYYRQDHAGGEHFFGVCPECDNPIQIVGLFRNTAESGCTPYGRHNKGDVRGIAPYCEEDYLNCPYSNPRWAARSDGALRSAKSQLAKDMLRLMYEQFDRVIYVVSKEMEIRMSYPMAGKLLRQFMDHEAWRYRMATLNNLPWILMETAASTPLYGQWLCAGGALETAIRTHCPAALLRATASPKYVQLLQKPGAYLNVQFFFLRHEKRVDAAGHLEEQIDFQVTDGTTCIYQKTIQIETDYFLNLIHLPAAQSHRNQRYLDLAHQMICPEP